MLILKDEVHTCTVIPYTCMCTVRLFINDRMVQSKDLNVYCVHLCQLRIGIALDVHGYLKIRNFSSSVQLETVSHEWVQCMSEISSWTHTEKINSIATSSNVLFCLFYKHANDKAFDNFLKIPKHLMKISEDCPKFVRRPDNHFWWFSDLWRLPLKDFWR